MRRAATAAGLRDAVIVNTCAVTSEAERQARQAIRRLKRENPDRAIIVTGCSAEINRSAFAAMPEVAQILPNDTKLKPESFAAPNRTPLPPPLDEPAPSPSGPLQRAFVQIQNGCDHRCTFCVIPFGRGASRSLPFAAIHQQIAAHSANGFQEIVLTGVDITSYGRDLSERPTLGRLVRQILRATPDLPRLRLSSLDPAAIDEDLWRALEEEPRLMPHWHLSLQAGDDLILKRMKRRHSGADIDILCARARRARPEIILGADLIAGFPTETDAMFAQTYDRVERCGITWLHVFAYSARHGTPAARMPQGTAELRKSRAERLRALGAQAAARHHHALVGREIDLLIEKNGIGTAPDFTKLKLSPKITAPIGSLTRLRCIGIENGMPVAG